MPTHLTRRDILKLVGGSAVGFFFTPVPWKLLDDTSIWTQNWSKIPPLPRGERTTRYSACTLCPGGCAVRAQLVGPMPYSLRGVSGHPVSRGFLCAVGLAGHHMAFHPLRLASPVRVDGAGDEAKVVPISADAAMRMAAAKIREGNGSVALLDCQPGRAVSAYYEDLARMIENGLYVTAASREDSTLQALRSMIGEESAPLGFDFENTSMILSFGAPLLDGWGSPGRLERLLKGKPDRSVRFVQVEHRQSRTALQADLWVPVNPGGERALALSIAHVLLMERPGRRTSATTIADMASYKETVARYTPEAARAESGIEPALVRQVAEELSIAPASIVLSGPDAGGGPMERDTEYAVAGLNLLLGNVGKKGGVVFLHEMPGTAGRSHVVRDIRDVPDHSLNLLIIDPASSGYAVPWKSLERKLCPGTGMVVSLAATMDEIAAHADIVVPAPAPYESLQDVPTQTGASAATFGLSTPLLPADKRSVDPASFVAGVIRLAGFPLPVPQCDDLLKERGRMIHAERRGTIYQPADGSTVRVAELAQFDELWTKLAGAGVWVDDPKEQHEPAEASLGASMLQSRGGPRRADPGLLLIPYGYKRAVSGAAISPILSKLSQESALRPGAGTVALHPVTAALSGVVDAECVLLDTTNGTMKLAVRIDRSVRPGVAEAVAGPIGRHGADIMDLCDVREDGTWRMTNANVRKA